MDESFSRKTSDAALIFFVLARMRRSGKDLFCSYNNYIELMVMRLQKQTVAYAQHAHDARAWKRRHAF